jgi:hypothetical protein
MDKKPILLVLLLTLAIVVAYVGVIASVPTTQPSPNAVGQVKLEVTGAPGGISVTNGQVTLEVV